MKISTYWLRKYVPFTESPQKIAQRLEEAGVEVGGIQTLGNGLEKIVIVEILSIRPHPNADRLSLVLIQTGKEELEIVCGAKNIAPKQKVPLAPVGCRLPNGQKIEASKIRGVLSNGMLCSAKELDLAEDAAGIFILPDEAPIGVSLSDYLNLPDVLLDLEITPNRPDLLSHFGMAREIAALTGAPLHFPEIPHIPENPSPATSPKIALEVQTSEWCPLYSGRILRDIQVCPSPPWLRFFLERLGHRSINNVVDITNFVLFELGQPLHAFDLDRLQGEKIIVRCARDKERIRLLDGNEVMLTSSDLVIADEKGPCALAGIMGGEASGIQPGSRNLFLESAWFAPPVIRRTAKRLGLQTDSSYRFERGVDPDMVLAAQKRAITLFQSLAGARLESPPFLFQSQPFKKPIIDYQPEKTQRLLGVSFPREHQKKIFLSLRCEVQEDANGAWKVTPPSFRRDLLQSIDLVEEIARVEGYAKVPAAVPRFPLIGQTEGEFFQHMRLKALCREAGLMEIRSSSFLPSSFSTVLGLTGDVRRIASPTLNPIAEDQKYLRPNLCYSLLSAAQLNAAHQGAGGAFFELGKTFHPLNDENAPPREQWSLGVLWWGKKEAPWPIGSRPWDPADCKGFVEYLIRAFSLTDLAWENALQEANGPWAKGGFQVTTPDGGVLVRGGQLRPRLAKAFHLSPTLFYLEIEDLGVLWRCPKKRLFFTPLPRHPAAWRDLSLVAPQKTSILEIETLLKEAGSPLLKEFLLFDLYEGDKIPKGTRSLAYRLRFQEPDRTLTDEEVQQAIEKILKTLKERLSIDLRQ